MRARARNSYVGYAAMRVKWTWYDGISQNKQIAMQPFAASAYPCTFQIPYLKRYGKPGNLPTLQILIC